MQQELAHLLCAFGLCCTVWGCATGPRVKVVAEVVDPERARSRSVSVLADSFMTDRVEADNVAQLVRDQLSSQGFAVKEFEEEAELIVIPTVQRSGPAETATAARRMLRPFDIPYGPGQASLMQSQTAMRNLGFEFGTLPVQEQPRVGLMVTAIAKQVWMNVPVVSESEIPRVWRVVALTGLGKEDVTAKLVEAVGAKLAELMTTAPPLTQPSPTPSPTPKIQP
jgi:hypothetical protein